MGPGGNNYQLSKSCKLFEASYFKYQLLLQYNLYNNNNIL